MSNHTRNVERLARDGVKVALPVDEHGYIGRECPQPDCLGYFKIVLGTGLSGTTDCVCPYCGHRGDHKTFWTKEQNDYVQSVLMREVTRAMHADLKSLEFEVKPKGAFGIGLSMKMKPVTLPSVRAYEERELETHVECSSCTLRYAIYGVFAWCPDCASHNSLQILERNLALVEKMLALSQSQAADLSDALTRSALDAVVSSFDGYGRATVEAHMQKAAAGAFAKTTSFQNIVAARDRVIAGFGHDISACMTTDEWDLLVRLFQQRHVVTHRMGVADDEYVNKSGDDEAVPGRLVRIEREEIRSSIALLLRSARALSTALAA